MSVLYGQISTDSAVEITTKTVNERARKFRVYIDVEKNAPIVELEETGSRNTIGTTVTLKLNGNLKRARERIQEYLRLTAISTPYARLSLELDDLTYSFGGTVNDLPSFPSISKPHPRSADMEVLRRLIIQNPDIRLQDFLISSFQQVGTRTASRFLNFLNLDGRQLVKKLSRKDLIHLSKSLRNYDDFGRPSADCLSPIGKESFLSSIRSDYQTSQVSYSARGPLEWEGSPYIIEGVLAIGDQFPLRDIPSLVRFANRVPLLYDSADDVFSKVLKQLTWSRYGVGVKVPVALFVHFCSTRVPYSAAGKQSIASVADIDTEILSLYRDLGRRYNKMTNKARQAGRYQRKRREFSKTFNLLMKFSMELAGTSKMPKTESMIDNLFEVDEGV